jgi:hypothetical protein
MAHAKKRQQQQHEQRQLVDLLNVYITHQQAHSEQRKVKQRGTKQSPPSTRQQQQQHKHHHQQQQQQQALGTSEEHLLQVAQALVDALGMNPTQPLSEAAAAAAAAAAEGTQPAGSSSSSSSTGTRRRSHRSSRKTTTTSSSSSSGGEVLSSSAVQLAAALARTSRNVAFRGRAAPQPQHAAAFAAEVAAAAGMPPGDVFALLLQRPALLWGQDLKPSSSAAAAATAAAAARPGDMLQHLHSQLPDLSLPLLLQRTPALLAAPKQHVEAVLTLLLNRLKLSKSQTAEIVMHHPRLLIAGAGPASLNLGFLVGLGLRQPELQQMLLKDAEWLTRPLQELTAQWQFVTTVAKVRRWLQSKLGAGLC